MFPSLASSETNIKLPFSFIIYGLIAFIVSQILFLISGNNITMGVFQVPTIWSGVHLLILGWALMIAMGAMYQLVPVAFLTQIWNETFGFIQFGVYAIGVTGFAYALFNAPALMVYMGSLALLGIVMFVFQMFMTLKSQKNKNILTVLVGTSMACLLITVTLGILLASDLDFGIDINHIKVLKSHLIFGITGWFTLLIFTFSYKLAPMFSLSHGYSMKLSKPIYIIYICGLLITISSFIFDIRFLFQLGLFALLAAFYIFSYHIYTIYLKRLKKVLDKPFAFSLIAIIFGVVIHFLAVILSFFPDLYHLYGVIIYLYLFMWIVFSILGYLYKIVPFLWWTYKYSEKMGKQNVPTLKQMMNDKITIPIFAALAVGVLGVALSIIIHFVILFYICQSVIVLAAIIYSYSVINVLRQ